MCHEQLSPCIIVVVNQIKSDRDVGFFVCDAKGAFDWLGLGHCEKRDMIEKRRDESKKRKEIRSYCSSDTILLNEFSLEDSLY